MSNPSLSELQSVQQRVTGGSGNIRNDVSKKLSFPSLIFYLFTWFDSPSGSRHFHCWGFWITLRQITLSTTPLDEGLARRGDFYLTTHYTHKKQTLMSTAWFEPAIPGSKRSQTQALDCGVTGIGLLFY